MNVTVTVPDQNIADAFCAAIEGGITYWCSRYEKKLGDLSKIPTDSGLKEFPRYWAPLTGGSLTFFDGEDEDKAHTLDGAALARGLAVMGEKYPRHLKDLIEDSGDATTGDVLVQCCIFGEVVYG